MSSQATAQAFRYCETAIEHKVALRDIVSHLENIFDSWKSGDEPTLLNKGDHLEIWLVFDDSRPSQLIYKLPRGYK